MFVDSQKVLRIRKKGFENVADVTIKNLNPIINTVITYLIAAIKDVFVWCTEHKCKEKTYTQWIRNIYAY